MNTYKKFEGKLSKQLQLNGGDFLAVETLDNDTTNNSSLWDMWDIVNQEMAKISNNPSAAVSSVEPELVKVSLESIDRIFAAMSKKIQTRANLTFSRTYGVPRAHKYEPYPVRWPGANRLALKIILNFVESAFSIPQVPCNQLDKGIIENHAGIIMRPLYDTKAMIMREYFGLEIKGEVSVDELQATFRNADLVPPIQTSILDRRDTRADLTAEDERAIGDESGKIPTHDESEAIRAGHDVWLWKADKPMWDRFGMISERLESAGVVQVPPEPFPFTTEVIQAGSVN